MFVTFTAAQLYLPKFCHSCLLSGQNSQDDELARMSTGLMADNKMKGNLDMC